jgi:hypothetical protein
MGTELAGRLVLRRGLVARDRVGGSGKGRTICVARTGRESKKIALRCHKSGALDSNQEAPSKQTGSMWVKTRVSLPVRSSMVRPFACTCASGKYYQPSMTIWGRGFQRTPMGASER